LLAIMPTFLSTAFWRRPSCNARASISSTLTGPTSCRTSLSATIRTETTSRGTLLSSHKSCKLLFSSLLRLRKRVHHQKTRSLFRQWTTTVAWSRSRSWSSCLKAKRKGK
jgi:hypothetical protein